MATEQRTVMRSFKEEYNKTLKLNVPNPELALKKNPLTIQIKSTKARSTKSNFTLIISLIPSSCSLQYLQREAREVLLSNYSLDPNKPKQRVPSSIFAYLHAKNILQVNSHCYLKWINWYNNSTLQEHNRSDTDIVIPLTCYD